MIQVTMLDTVELATYSVRTFALFKVRTLCVNHPSSSYCPELVATGEFCYVAETK